MRILLLLLLAGCASSKPTYLPDGSMGHMIGCSGSAASWGMCYEKAGQLCGPKGYTVVAGGAEQGAVVTATGGTVFGGSTMTRSMMIKCN